MERKRSPVAAAVLSLLIPGLGQLYNARAAKAGVIYLLGLLVFLTYSLTGIAARFYGLILIVLIVLIFYLLVMRDAVRDARRLAVIKLQEYNRWYFYLGIFLANTIVVSVVESVIPRTLKAYKIPADSMRPTLQVGDHIIVDLTPYRRGTPRRGDIVVFVYPEDPSKDFVKRIIGLPGETLEIRSKKVFINGQELEDRWGTRLEQDTVDSRDSVGPVLVPAGNYFVLGDNRDRSYDSRFWGFVDRAQIKGRVLYVYWAKDWGRIGKVVE